MLRKARRLGEDDPDELVWSRLSRSTLDGVEVTALGVPGHVPADLGPSHPQRSLGRALPARHGRPGRAHEAALTDLEGGVTSLWLCSAAVPDFATVLADVLVDLAPVVLDVPSDPVGAAEAFLAWADGRELAPGTNLGAPADAAEDDLRRVAGLAAGAGLLGVVVDAAAVHDRGASEVQELAASLAQGVRVLRLLAAEGTGVADAAALLEFRYAVTDEQLVSIAKLRAARRLWARVLGLSGSDQATMRQHAVTSRP